MLGLPHQIRTCLFDLDGVLTRTAELHAAAWREAFDGYLKRFGEFEPFSVIDYATFVDGRPRLDGVRRFLGSRGVELPEGAADDPPEAETVHGLAHRKDILVTRRIHTDGVAVYPGSLLYLGAVRKQRWPVAVVSASEHCAEILHAAGLVDLVDAWVDGLTAAARGLRGKPAPDTYLAAAELVGAVPSTAAVFEDALAGVEAGKAGGFGFVVGVDRLGQADQLRRHGADRVVADLVELGGES